MRSTTLLIVEDEPNIREPLADYLRADGFEVHTAGDGLSALQQARVVRPDLIILDVQLPGVDGIEVCRRVQQEFDVYVLMLTARSDEIDKIVGLSVGADDYLTKPFSPRELLVRVKAILRRSRIPGLRAVEPALPTRPSLRFQDLLIDPDTREVWRRDTTVELTPREFDLLYALADQPGRAFSRDQLLERVWGHDFAGIDRVVDVHIGTLRRKLEDDPNNPSLIQTVRGTGYKFVGRRA
ncbi:MAG TPA: response regulator transcription factor [Roseiflexaceae bacterium]|nr:response regulator transcription factor [Roseiflexaceae bacterium]